MELVNTDKSKDQNKVTISRQLYTQDAYDNKYPAEEEDPFVLSEAISNNCNGSCFMDTIIGYFPILKGVKNYKPKEYVLGDFLSGLTVSFLHLPMAMGFGILAGLRPINGLYATFWPVLIYMFFGTSPYISFGTNAVMALLTKDVVESEGELYKLDFMSLNNGTEPSDDVLLGIRIDTSMACCFLSGIILMVMGILKMGVITTYMSTSFVGGFTTAAAIHIASSQVPKMFGIPAKGKGIGKLIKMYIDLLSKIGDTNLAEIIICLICMAVLLCVTKFINEKYKDKMKMPIPIDLVVVIIGTIISHFADFNGNFDVKVVGDIPSGFQPPGLPRLVNMGNFFADAFVMAILSLMMSISMAKLMARKHGMPIDDNQELSAYGASNFVSGFFQSFPAATAPPRTMILSNLGAKSLLNGVTTSVFIMLVILVIGQLFVSLPMSVLAAMIIASMKDLLLQYRNLPRIWRVNKYDFFIWVITNSVSVLADLKYGIIAGMFASILLVVIRDQCSSGQVVSVADNEDIIISAHDQLQTAPLRGIKVFRFPASFYFATAEKYKRQIYADVLNPKKKDDDKPKDAQNGTSSKTHAVVLDFANVNYIDMAGIINMTVMYKDYKKADVTLYLAGVKKQVMATLDEGDYFKTFDKTNVFFDVFDAVTFIQKHKGVV